MTDKTVANPLASLIPDENGEKVQIGSVMTTLDSSGTPKASPLAYSSTEIVITIPDRAVEMVLAPSTALRVSEVTGMANYYVIPANAAEVIACARMATLYIKRDSADGTLNFRFNNV